MSKQTKWLPLFKQYLKNLRIQSKHAEDDPDGSGIELKLWTSQSRVLEEVCAGLEDGVHTFYILKSRQLGVTTITLAILLFWLALHPNTIGCLAADSEKNKAKNRETLRRYIGSLSRYMGKTFSVSKDNAFGFVFSNGSRLDMLVAGNKVNWGEGEGYLVGHLTEVASYKKAEGIESFRHAMAPENPRALYIFESTAHGPNHWKDMWDAARSDPYSSRCIFVGWWSHDLQRIARNDRRFQAFGSQPPTPEENDRIVNVRDLYNYNITMEQLAWFRWQETQPNSNSTDLDQNQPFTEFDCFVQSGVSFFGQGRISERLNIITSAEPASVEDGGFGYKAYSFYLGDEYHLSKVEPITDQVHPDGIKLRVWEHPHPEGMYIIGVDPALGRSEMSNNHCCSVWRAFADKLVQVAEWADNIPDTRHCAWVTAYLAGQYANCRINIDLTGGVGAAVMQEFDGLRQRMRSELYQGKVGDFTDFLSASNWYLYRRVDSPGAGYMYATKLGRDLKWKTMNMLRDSFATNLLEIRSVPLLHEMETVVQERYDIGAAAPGRQRDDRTFAMALANTTWIENLRQGMIAQGITWEMSRQAETGQVSRTADMLNRRVYSILRAAEDMEEGPPPKTFFESRGLA
jgi:hypothetical protein